MAVTYSNRLRIKAGPVLRFLVVCFVLLPGAILTQVSCGPVTATWTNPPDLNEKWTLCPGPGKFVTCLCSSNDSLWVGTEDTGLWHLDLSADPADPGSWQKIIDKDGPGDNVYGLTVDAFGRLWAGTLNRGVSVFNGSDWKTYGVLEGCPGDRVFSLAADTDPNRGRVWIATGRGLTCWTPAPHAWLAAAPRPGQGVWRTFTQADGLPSANIYSVAVAKDGRVWAGTECDGLAWSDPPYNKWTPVRAAAERSGDAGQAPGIGDLPSFSASGLPSNLTNALRILPDGTVAYATDYGLGLGRSSIWGQKWVSWQGLSKEPFENYIRNLATDPAGGLWLASTHKNLARLDPATGRLTEFNKPAQPCNYVFDVAVTKDGRVWAGTYGSGLACLAFPCLAVVAPGSKTGSENNGQTVVDLPEPPAPPTLDELNAMLTSLAKVSVIPPERQPAVVRLDDDWLTKGDCLGRYGRYWGCWCAICSPQDYVWGAGPEKVEYHARIGPHAKPGDSLRYWIHWLYTKNSGTLEMPPTYRDSRVKQGYMPADFTRREAEWTDHDDTGYPMTFDGPNIFCSLRIPAGLYFLSLYADNVNGHDGDNRYRDFPISVWRSPDQHPIYDIDDLQTQPELNQARIRDFCAGAYKRFLVHGPTEITVKLHHNHSFCTILSGVFLDLVDEQPVPYFHTPEKGKKLDESRAAQRRELQSEAKNPGARARRFRPAASEAEAAARLFDELERMRLTNAVWWAREGRVCYAPLLKWYLANINSEADDLELKPLHTRATTCYYRLGLYEKWEAGQTRAGLTTARQIEKSLKWDGVSSFEGKGFEAVSAYLTGKTGALSRDSNFEGAKEP